MDSLRSKCSKISCYTARNITPCLFYIVRFNLLLSEALKPPNVSQRGQKLLGLRPRSLLTSFRHIWRLLSPRQTQISPDNVKGKAEYCYQCNKILLCNYSHTACTQIDTFKFDTAHVCLFTLGLYPNRHFQF